MQIKILKLYIILDKLKTTIDNIIVLTKAWLGLPNLNYTLFTIPNYTVFKTTKHIANPK